MTDLDPKLLGENLLASQIAALARDLDGSHAEGGQLATRLRQGALRPLVDLRAGGDLDSRAANVPPTSVGDLAGRLIALARSATALLANGDNSAALGEAVASLQDLAIGHSPDAPAATAEFVAMLSSLPTRIRLVRNGPYLVTNPPQLCDWLGDEAPSRPQLALCRCGRSQTKPICDGSHASGDFSDAKDPGRVVDRQDTYPGLQVTVHDNRGICQHSGLCTDRATTAFRVDQDPFVAPSGARMDEIIRAVRDCPSGALSYSIDGVEARADVDWHDSRPARIEITKNGPYRVSGSIPLVDVDEATVACNAGASREHYALCRCGQSRNKPFCSGMHWYVDFTDPPTNANVPTVFEWAGGMPALLRLTRVFYEKHVPEDPLLAPLFANMAVDHPQRVAAWLAEVFGGPKGYSTAFGGYPRMLSQHLGKQISEEQRERWVTLLARSARDAGLPNDAEFRSTFDAYIEWGTRLAVENSHIGAQPPPRMPMPHWDWYTSAGPPGSRPSAAPRDDEKEVETAMDVPEPGQPLTFAQHVKPLFRAQDQRSMSFVFDLWSESDVTNHAAEIIARLRAGTMPCDGAWPAQQIDLLQRWVDQESSASGP